MEVLVDTCGLLRVRNLLLIYLFVLEAAADCPKPQAIPDKNIVLTNEAILKNDFPEGIRVTLECANGYIKESGSGVINCLDGAWTEPDLTCKKKDCGPPVPKQNESFNISAGTLFGAVIKVICDKGYQISGSSFRQCYATGWVGRSTCEIVTCEIPAEVTNGKRLWDSGDEPQYGEKVSYSCDEGYTLKGSSVLTCNENGEYDSQPPECKGVVTDSRRTTVIVTSTPTPTSAPTSTPTPTSAPTSTPTSTLTEVIFHVTEGSSTTESHRSNTISTSAVLQGGRDIMTTGDDDKASTSVTPEPSSLLKEKKNEAVNITNKGYTAVIISVVASTVVVVVLLALLNKYLLRRKGSYDTREDQTRKFSQFRIL